MITYNHPINIIFSSVVQWISRVIQWLLRDTKFALLIDLAIHLSEAYVSLDGLVNIKIGFLTSFYNLGWFLALESFPRYDNFKICSRKNCMDAQSYIHRYRNEKWAVLNPMKHLSDHNRGYALEILNEFWGNASLSLSTKKFTESRAKL